MITGQQLLDAIVHADEWPNELMRLRSENAELRRQLDVERAKAQREQASSDFYFQLYLDATREHK